MENIKKEIQRLLYCEQDKLLSESGKVILNQLKEEYPEIYKDKHKLVYGLTGEEKEKALETCPKGHRIITCQSKFNEGQVYYFCGDCKDNNDKFKWMTATELVKAHE